MTDNTTRRAMRLQAEYERRQASRFMAHTPRPWGRISQPERDEHIGITRAVLNGETKYNGTKIPAWARMIIEEPL
ncbi:hypothetical protein HW450_06665 [Corynebacterium hindlerae]|uniref:Uncharacterized protein n=1 Tax=Corynebacterium hindlerae TaxID=699041 RepID=A0A7G5FBT3_9CORY|nr:hypothetical protein [Corynebacterium hindlerae]QMV84074.1 hypothetical protein HW450_06665 [Corynebacterium hindlerae]